MAKNISKININLIVSENTSLEICRDKFGSLDDNILTQFGFTKEYTKNEKTTLKKDVYCGLIHYFFTKKLEDSDIKSLLNGSKWEKKTLDEIYNPQERLICNFIGVVSREFTVKKSEIIEAAGKTYINSEKKVAGEQDNSIIIHGKDATKNVNLTIQIISRFDRPGKPYFLETMLLKGENIFISDQPVLASSDGYFDFLLMVMFRNCFREATKKGYYKAYHTFQANDSKLKGAIDFNRHIRLNVGKENGNIAYSYRENSVINYMNMLILAAYDSLKRKYNALTRSFIDSKQDLYSKLQFIRYEISDHMRNVSTVISKSLIPISHPYYADYEALRKICLKVLRHEGMGFEDSNFNTQGILYYVPDLWEEYLESVIRANYMDVDCQKSIGIVSDETISKPDFLLKYKDGEKSHYYMILDAKFKKKWYDVYSSKFTLKKYGEDYNKCIRDMESLSMHAAGVIFPYNDKLAGQGNEGEENNSNKQEESNYSLPRRYSVCEEGNKKDLFYTIPIKIPNAEDESNSNYDEWRKSFDEFVESQMNNLKTIADYEQEFFENEKKLECMLDELSKLSTPGELDPSKLTEFKAILGKREARQKDVEAAANKPIDVKCIEINENSSEERENDSL